MRYTVTWRPPALQKLADLWVSVLDRREITEAAHVLDNNLARTPHAVGEARAGVTRIAFEGPLGIFFDVSDDDRLVSVWSVWSR